MVDLYHVPGSDLVVGPTGDLLTVSADAEALQRIERRLTTNAGDYIFHLPYGAGLPAQVGRTLNVTAIQNLVRSQIFAEAAVARLPEPVITVTSNGVDTTMCSIEYTSALTGMKQTLTFKVPNGA